MAEVTITKDNFEAEVLRSDRPVLLDLWAQWCGPCQMLAPIVAELAEEHAQTLKVGKINVDDEPELAMQFRVQSIPMLILMKNGEAVRTAVGYRSKAELEKLLAETI